VQRTRFVWQEIKRTRPRFRSGLRQLLIFYALLQQASNSQNAQWRSQKPFKPCAEFCNLFAGHKTSIYFEKENGLGTEGIGLNVSEIWQSVCEKDPGILIEARFFDFTVICDETEW
jgi:hypothetical protein